MHQRVRRTDKGNVPALRRPPGLTEGESRRLQARRRPSLGDIRGLRFTGEQSTAGPKEARAWTVKRNTQAPKAAGVIHTDFEKGFIRAETIAYDDYISLGGENAAKDAGKMRLEGKEYVVNDGDIMLFRFNV